MNKLYASHLWEQIITTGDQQAFRFLYNSYFIPLFRFALTLVKSKETAEEIVNDVFMHCWKKRKELSPVRNVQTYLFTAVKNLSIDHIRKTPGRQDAGLDELEEVHLKFTTDPEQLFITAELLKKMEKVIAQLPPQCRLIYIMVKQHGLKYREVAQALDLSVKTVENQLAIAVKKLSRTVRFILEEPLPKK